MKAELALWRFGVGLSGGRWVAVALFALIALAYAALAFAVLHPLRLLRSAQPLLDITALFAGSVFLLLAHAPTALRGAWRTRSLLQLAPGAKRLTSAITLRLIVTALIAMVPAVVLRALLWSKLNADTYATISLSDISLENYVLVTLYFSHLVLLMAITFGPLKVSTRFLFLPIMYGTMRWSSESFLWLPLASCIVLVIARFCWPALESWMGDRPYWVRPRSERATTTASWGISRLQQRAASAGFGTKGASLRVVALLANKTRVAQTVVTVAVVVAYLTIKPGFMDSLAVSWLMACPTAVLLAQLTPIPLSRIMLLPLGAIRTRVGELMTAVWVRQLTARMFFCAIIGVAVHAICWWLQWPAFIRSQVFASVDVTTQLLWSPLAQSVGLWGMALSACLLCSTSPTLIAAPSFLRLGPFAAVITLAVVGIVFKWALNEWIPATNANDMGHVTFAVVNGAMLPACAWCVNRALRYQWGTANLSAISAAMQKWSQQLQKVPWPN